ncbi:MAG: T9SS type A sorting domain-containing protein, partial [Chitinophagales bacterium]
LPIGSKVYARTCYDNTIYNPNNPHNPPEDIHYGESSTDEMSKFLLNMLEYQDGDENLILDSNYVSTNVAPIDGLVTNPQLYPLSPNPAASVTYITYYLPKMETVDFFVTDGNGRSLRKFSGTGNVGFNQLSLDVTAFNNGNYFITMKTASREVSKQLLIQR